MKKLATLCLLFAALAGAGCTGKTEKKSASKGPVPMTHILICCRSSNEGVIRFKVGDEWITNHDYRNIDHARAILSTIQQAGINDVIIDLTNPSQWAETPASWPGCQPGENALWETETKDQIATIEQVCEELGMRFVMFIGNPAAHTLAYWNGIAERTELEVPRILYEINSTGYKRTGNGKSTFLRKVQGIESRWGCYDGCFHEV